MRQETISIYKFDELSEEAKEKALEKLWGLNVDYDWWDHCYKDIQAVGEALGVVFREPGKRFYFNIDRGSYFSFEGSLDFSKMVECWNAGKLAEYAPKLIETFSVIPEIMKKGKRLLKWDFGEVYVSSNGEKSYYDVNTWSCTGDSSNVDELLDDIGEEMTELLDDFRNWALQSLRNEYEWRLSEEQIIESIRANEYEFTEDGELY